MKIKIDRFQPTLYLFLCFFFLDIQGADKPLILETKIENPKSIIFIGNSFFYYNNGVHKPHWAW
tara:strand:+ start:279 stop:470 length:192 start_codon:yes stop_codon:yes gene_type:complete